MKKVNITSFSLLFALFGGVWHLIWVVLISVDTASPLVDIVLWLHFFKLPLYVEPPALPLAVLLIVLTAMASAVIGLVLATLWNVAAGWITRIRDSRAHPLRLPAQVLGADSE